MSAGDKHQHVLLGEREYDRALHDVRFQAFRHRPFCISFDYDIPYLGGYSRDGSMIYIDKDTPAEMKRGRRVYPILPTGDNARQLDQVFNTSAPLGRYLIRGIIVHEHWEKTAIDAWRWGYAESHELATHAENHFARDVLGIDPDDYEKLWQPIIKAAEKKLHRADTQWPPDIDRTPYK